MSNSVEQQGGFFAYLWNNLAISVASRTVGSNMNDGNPSGDELAAIFASNLSKISMTAIGEVMLRDAIKMALALKNLLKTCHKIMQS